MYKLWERIKVLAKALPTWAVLASAVVVENADTLAGAFSDVTPQDPEALIVQIAAVVAAVVGIVRRVTPVPKAQRGLVD